MGGCAVKAEALAFKITPGSLAKFERIVDIHLEAAYGRFYRNMLEIRPLARGLVPLRISLRSACRSLVVASQARLPLGGREVHIDERSDSVSGSTV